MISVDQLVRQECGDFYEQRRVLLLRMLAAISDPDRRSPNNDIRGHAERNRADLVRIIGGEWKGRRGPQFGRLLRRAEYQLIAALSDGELAAFHADVFHQLARALPPQETHR